MITGTLRNQIDKLWTEFWTGGITNPLTVIEQISFLMFSRLLDIAETRAEKRAARLSKPFKGQFGPKEQKLRWSNFKNLDAQAMLKVVRDEVFPHFRTLGDSDSTFAEYMTDAQLFIQKPSLLVSAVNMIDDLPLTKEVHAGIHRACPVEFGDVLFVKDGANTGNAAVNTLKEPFSLLSSVALLKPKRGTLDPAYLVHWLNCDEGYRCMTQNMSGSAIRRLILNEIRTRRFPLPPLPEQRRIAAILDKADAIRRKREEGIRLTEELLRSTFLETFGDPATNPNGWPLRPFGELVANEDGRRKPVKEADRAERHGEYPYYGASGIIDYIDEFLFDERTLLIAEDGANLLARATPIAFIAEGKYWVNNHAHVVSDNGQADLDYLRFSLNLRRIDDFVTGSAQPKLNQASLNRIPVQMPPLQLQRKFASIVEKTGMIRQQRQHGKEQTEVLFASLVQRAFRGEL